ncbi:MAG: hypothetical protein JWO82_2301, partial [Akkermansiaceae bacterium]|nr:hypothetical protein [Akkermansiaceae bacterium]
MRALLRRGVERHPLLWAALLAVAAVLTADGVERHGLVLAWTGGLVLLLLSCAVWLAGRRTLALGCLGVALLAGGLHAVRLGHQRHALEAALPGLDCTVRVISVPKSSGRGWSAMVISSPDGASRWWFRGTGAAPAFGETLHATGRFEELPVTRNPGQFDFKDWLFRQGASGVFQSRSPQQRVAAPGWIDRLTTGLRQNFSQAITRGLDPLGPEAAVIRAMVLGEIPPDPAITDPFRTSGTLHAFSVSGMHVAMLGAIGWFLLRSAGVPRRAAVVILIAGMTAYVWITGMSPPAIRSLTMATVFLSGFLLRRRGSLANILGFALLAAVLLAGHLIFLAGVQLSFGVVAAIAFWTAYTARPFQWLTAMDPYLPRQLYSRPQRLWLWCRKWLAGTLGVSTAATLGSLPLLIWHFGLVSPVSILAGLMMGPLIFALMS